MNIIGFILLIMSSLFPAQDDPLKLDEAARKKLDKSVMSTFNIEAYTIEPLESGDDSNFFSSENLTSGKFFQIHHEGMIAGLLYLGTAKGRYDWFDFMILYNNERIIERVEILIYRSDHGFEIMNKRWLEQFKGTNGCESEYGRNIDAISGATLSATSLTKAIQEACSFLR